MTESVTVEADGRAVEISHPDKLFFSGRGETKLDLVRYYQAVAEPLMRSLRERPLLLERYPNGAGGKSWFQKRVPKHTPPWLRTTEVATPNGTTSDALVAADLAHVLWGVNLGCLGFHVWPFRAANQDIADELRIDLDPSAGVGFDEVRAAAARTRQLLGELGIEAGLKTSGSRGLHIYVALQPRWDGYRVRSAAVALARLLERRHPELITAQWWKEERGKRVFFDYNQNAPHKTVFGAWCVRPTPAAPVSTPIEWDELDDVQPETFTIASVPDRLAERGDPWAHLEPQSIEPLLTQSERDLAAGMMDAPWPPVYPKMPNEPPRVAPSRAKQE